MNGNTNETRTASLARRGIRYGAVLPLVACLLHGAVLHVDDSNTAGTHTGTIQYPFATIQAAIVAAASGDTINVALGDYAPITTLGKALTLRGGYPGATPAAYASGLGGDFTAQGPAPSATVIRGDGTSNGVTFTRFTEEPYFAVLDNFTVRDNLKGVVCDTQDSWPQPTNVVISRNCIEHNGRSNETSRGAGVLAVAGGSVIANNIIRGNQGGRGPGIISMNGDGTLSITSNLIAQNICYDDHGGGLVLYGDVVVTRNVIVSNRVAMSYGWGGGVMLHSAGTLLRSDSNIICGNHAPSYGGGVYVDEGAQAGMRNDLLHHNTTDEGHGGGVALDSGVPGPSHLQLVNCTVVYNNHGAAHPGFGGNGVYIDNDSTAVVVNCIFWGNGHSNDFYVRQGSSLNVSYSLAEKAMTGTAMLTNDPLFIAVGMGDYHVQSDSPCVNSGSNLPWMVTATDLDGNPRIAMLRVDMGCYEVVPEPLVAMTWALLGMLLVARQRRNEQKR